MAVNDNEKIRFANMVIADRKQSIEKTISPGIPSQILPVFKRFLTIYNHNIELELTGGAYTIDDEFPIIYGAIEDQFWDWASYTFDNPFEWDNYPHPLHPMYQELRDLAQYDRITINSLREELRREKEEKNT